MTLPRRLGDRYELGETLGFGGMSEVYRACDVRLHRDVAVKVLRADLARDPGSYLRFRREAQNAGALNHPAIVAVYDTGVTETTTGAVPYIVMEFVDGITLRDTVRDDGPMEPVHAIEVIADACQALDFSHQHGIIHRDVKPANIMISTTGAVKVMDFGIARTLTDTTGGNRLTQTAAIIGTAHYLSPEQARGETVDRRSDVYSLGCVFYELITGEPPFVGDSPVAVAYQHVREDPVAPSQRRAGGISLDLDAVVLKALAKNPENRYQSAAEMRTDLIRLHVGDAPHATKVFTATERTGFESSPQVIGRWPHRSIRNPQPGRGQSVRRWLTAVALAAILTAVATVAIKAHDGRNQAVRVPDVHGQAQQDAVATLQNLGFKIRGPVPRPDPSVPVGHVIGTVPGAHIALAGGDEITVTVSSGPAPPEQRAVPVCSNLTITDCVRRLAEGGFTRSKPLPIPSATVLPHVVISTDPGSGQISAVTNTITVVVSTGPETRRVPDVSGQALAQATMNLKTAGFPIALTGPVDSVLPQGQVVSTDPPAGTNLSVWSAVMMRVSRGNQFLMPNVIGRTYVDVVPFLEGLGYVGALLNGGDVPGSEDDRNRVVRQDPPAGTAVTRDGVITLDYGS